VVGEAITGGLLLAAVLAAVAHEIRGRALLVTLVGLPHQKVIMAVQVLPDTQEEAVELEAL